MKSLNVVSCTGLTMAVSVMMLSSMSVMAEDVQRTLDGDIQYAPRQRVIQGSKTLTCLGIEYQDSHNGVSASSCGSLARNVAEFYRRNSRGLLQLKTRGVRVKVPFDGKQSNYPNAVKFAKAQYPGSDLYLATGNFGVSHASGGVAFLRGTLSRDASHEVGHLLGLGHAGRYEYDHGKRSFNAYGDGLSVMSRFPSSTLSAPQYYSRGWLYENEAAIYEPGKTYHLRRITAFDEEGLALLIVKPEQFKDGEGRTAYISFPSGCGDSGCAVLHLATGIGAGTQKVATFGHEYYDSFTGLHIQVGDDVDGKVSISIDLAPKPASFVESLIQEADSDDSSFLCDDEFGKK